MAVIVRAFFMEKMKEMEGGEKILRRNTKIQVDKTKGGSAIKEK